MTRGVSVTLLAVEVVVCFAIPAYFLFWGIVTMPLWLAVIQRGGDYAWWDLFETVAGSIGVIGLALTVRSCVSKNANGSFPIKFVLVSVFLGLAAIWDLPTRHFREFELDWFVFVFALPPTLCTFHLLVLALKRARRRNEAARSAA